MQTVVDDIVVTRHRLGTDRADLGARIAAAASDPIRLLYAAPLTHHPIPAPDGSLLTLTPRTEDVGDDPPWSEIGRLLARLHLTPLAGLSASRAASPFSDSPLSEFPASPLTGRPGTHDHDRAGHHHHQLTAFPAPPGSAISTSPTAFANANETDDDGARAAGSASGAARTGLGIGDRGHPTADPIVAAVGGSRPLGRPDGDAHTTSQEDRPVLPEHGGRRRLETAVAQVYELKPGGYADILHELGRTLLATWPESGRGGIAGRRATAGPVDGAHRSNDGGRYRPAGEFLDDMVAGDVHATGRFDHGGGPIGSAGRAAGRTGRIALVHGHLDLAHVGYLPGTETLLLTGPETLGLGDPAWDLGVPAGLWAAGFLDDASWRAFLNGYTTAGGHVPAEGEAWNAVDHPAACAVFMATVRILREHGYDDDRAAPLLRTCVKMNGRRW